MTEALRRERQAPPPELNAEQSQRDASDPRTSVWVNASAGSGKTTVLTNRVLRLLLDGVRPQAILCLTFTRAAAAEMAIRLNQKLGLWATCSDKELEQELDRLQNEAPAPEQRTEARRLFARVLACPGGMRIRTIHAFCQEILGRFPIEADLAPHFAIVEDDEARAMEKEALANVLREAETAEESPVAQALRTLVYDLGEQRFMPAMRNIMKERERVNTAISRAGGLDQLIVQLRSLLRVALEDNEQTIITAAVRDEALPLEDLRRIARRLLEGTKKYGKNGQTILDWLALPVKERIPAFSDYCGCFLTQKNMPFAEFINKTISTAHPEIDLVMGSEAARLQAVMEKLKTLRIAETTEAVLRFGLELGKRYTEQKTAKAALDYDDLINHAQALLYRPGIAPWILYKLDGGLDHILVDEAQDTSRAQWSIIQALADEFFSGETAKNNAKRTLFVVGDEKQSIFSFQNADPDAFAKMRDYFAERLKHAGKTLRSVNLHVSFRSAKAVLEAVDDVFAQPQALSGVSSTPVEHFAAKPRTPEAEKAGRVEIWPILSTPIKEKDDSDAWTIPADYEDEHDPQAALADTIALKIESLLKAKEILPGMERPLAGGDIMILLRNRGRFAELMVRALKSRNVPVTGVDRMQLTQPLAVMDLMAFMQFVLLPEDDLNLAVVLRSPLLNLGEDELLHLAAKRTGSLWYNLTARHKEPAYAKAAEYLTRWLNEADFASPFIFLIRLLNEPCPGNAISGRRALWARLGPDALDPIEELLSAAQNFSMRQPPSLQAFLHSIITTDAMIKREMDHSSGQVRIMTVHGSKGLEAPIVFMPDTTTLPRTQDVAKFLWDETSIPLYLTGKASSGIPEQLWNDARRKQLEEYRRLLYVALTRAAHRLYIAGWENRREKPSPDCWYNLIRQGLQERHMPTVMGTDKPQPMIAFADPVLRAPLPKTVDTADKIFPLPSWISQAVPEEPEIFRIEAPSHALVPSSATPDNAFARGKIIHRLLQSLPDVAESQRDAAAMRFLASPQHNLTTEQQQEIRQEVLTLFHDPVCAPIWGPGSRAEIPITGRIGNRQIAGQVDRLYIDGREVWIIDYKTNRPPPATAQETPEVYVRQLAEYRAILHSIYPDKTIRCFLLWTYKPLFIELPETILDRFS